MFIITFEDGKTLAQGANLNNWDDVPKEGRIAAVTLSDGAQIQQTISGCDFYMCCYVGNIRMRHVVNEAGVARFLFSSEPMVCGQELYGIRLHKQTKRQLTRALSLVRKEFQDVMEPLTGSVYIGAFTTAMHHQMTNRCVNIINELDDTEVEVVKLNVSHDYVRRDSLKIDDSAFLSGVPSEPELDIELLKRRIIEE